MPITIDYEFYKPKSIEETLGLLNKFGKKAFPLAGGTDLIIRLQESMDNPEAIIDLKGLNELKRLELVKNKLYIGSLVTFSTLIDSDMIKKKFPLIWEAAGNVASVPVRNRATMVGNICSCVPCMDSAPALLIYDTSVIVRSIDGERKIPTVEWFVGPRKTSLKENELVIGLEVSLPEKNNGTSYVKLKRYEGEDLAQACAGIMVLDKNEYRIAYGSVGPVPVRAGKIEKLLNGKKLSEKLIEEATRIVSEEISPITDIRASKEYRTHICKVMLERGLKAAEERMRGKGPKYGISLI